MNELGRWYPPIGVVGFSVRESVGMRNQSGTSLLIFSILLLTSLVVLPLVGCGPSKTMPYEPPSTVSTVGEDENGEAILDEEGGP